MSRERADFVIRTPRLTLHDMVADDLDFLAELLGDPLVMRYYPKPLSRDEARGWLERQWARYAADGHGFWLVRERESGRPVGQVGLLMQTVEAFATRQPEIGYLLHHPYWGRGYATEAAAAVRDHAFTALGYPHVISLILPENLPSRAVAQRIGMRVVVRTHFFGSESLVYRVDAPRGTPLASSTAHHIAGE